MVERILTPHGSAILKAIARKFAPWRVAFGLSCSRSSRLCVCGLRIPRPSRAAGLARSGRKRLLRPQAGHPLRHHRPGARDRRAGHLRHDPSAESLGARQRRDRGRQDADHRLPDDPGARGLARTTSSSPTPRPASGKGSRRVNVFGAYSCRRHRQYRRARGSPNMPSATRSMSPASRSPTGGRSISSATGRQTDSQEAAFLHEVARGRLPIFHHRPRAGRGRVPLQPHPSRSRQSRLDQHRPPPHLQADARARPSARARTARRPAARARNRGAARHRASEPRRRRRSARCGHLIRTGRGPDGALPPAPIGESDPAPPILPAGAGPSVDPSPTSSIRDHDN